MAKLLHRKLKRLPEEKDLKCGNKVPWLLLITIPRF